MSWGQQCSNHYPYEVYPRLRPPHPTANDRISLARRHLRRLPAVQDGLYDVGRKQREPENAAGLIIVDARHSELCGKRELCSHQIFKSPYHPVSGRCSIAGGDLQ